MKTHRQYSSVFQWVILHTKMSMCNITLNFKAHGPTTCSVSVRPRTQELPQRLALLLLWNIYTALMTESNRYANGMQQINIFTFLSLLPSTNKVQCAIDLFLFWWCNHWWCYHLKIYGPSVNNNFGKMVSFWEDGSILKWLRL